MALRLRTQLLLISGLAALSGAAGLSAYSQTQGAPSAAPAAQTNDPKTGLVMGQVVDADTGQPIPGAVVRLGMRTAAAAQGARAGLPGVQVPPQQLVEL